VVLDNAEAVSERDSARQRAAATEEPV